MILTVPHITPCTPTFFFLKQPLSFTRKGVRVLKNVRMKEMQIQCGGCNVRKDPPTYIGSMGGGDDVPHNVMQVGRCRVG